MSGEDLSLPPAEERHNNERIPEGLGVLSHRWARIWNVKEGGICRESGPGPSLNADRYAAQAGQFERSFGRVERFCDFQDKTAAEAKLQRTNRPEVSQHLAREYRKGWEL